MFFRAFERVSSWRETDFGARKKRSLKPGPATQLCDFGQIVSPSHTVVCSSTNGDNRFYPVWLLHIWNTINAQCRAQNQRGALSFPHTVPRRLRHHPICLFHLSFCPTSTELWAHREHTINILWVDSYRDPSTDTALEKKHLHGGVSLHTLLVSQKCPLNPEAHLIGRS